MKKYFVTLFLCAGFLTNAMAWDAVGHRIVAEIAYQNLTKKAAKQVDGILGKRGMVYCSSWADEIKSDTIYPYSHVWHYQNLRSGLTKDDLAYLYQNPKAEGKHLFYALDSLTQVLRKDKNDTIALKFVVHLMGDFFQPMHLGHPDDKGGNKVQMRWFGKGTNLHSVWDRYLREGTQLSYGEYVQYLNDTQSSHKKEIAQMTLFEGLCITYDRQNQIYAYQELGDNNNYHYSYRFRKDLDNSLYMAGIQLSVLLNELYK